MKKAYTPGPWDLIGVGIDIIKPCPHHRGTSILTVVEEGDTPYAAVFNQADAHLISAAPDLLEALEALLIEWEAMERVHGEHGQREVEMARKAIEKAKGTK